MEFSLEKCVCMHVGYRNKNFNYHLGETQLKSVEFEKDLSIIIDKNFKFTEQCANVVTKANQMLGIITRKIKYKSKDVIVKLYKTLVRPHLEYCMQFWSPLLAGEKKMIESVQRRALKLINGYKNISYVDRLCYSNLISLDKRRLRGDLIEMFKMSKDIETFNNMFKLNNLNCLRGNKFKVYKERCNLNVRKYFFNQRIVDVWNSLPNNVVFL